MKNIAILYDIENLVGGHHLKYLSELSLKKIIFSLKNIDLQNVAIQKAYADWSRVKLNFIKDEIVDLGIEAVQMYGFSKGNLKNASDIQLVIDAMDILHKKDFISTFIIISGDGGFGALVKKLKEYGKKIIGVAYKASSNTVFVSNCDEFYYINDFLTQEQQEKIINIVQTENQKRHINNDPILKSTLPYCNQISNYDFEMLRVGILDYIKLLVKNSTAKHVLYNRGLSISILKTAFKYIFVDFDIKIKEFGFSRFTSFLTEIYDDTNFKIIFNQTDYRLIAKTKFLKNFKTLKKDSDNLVFSDTNNQMNSLIDKIAFSYPLLKETLPLFERVEEYNLNKLREVAIKYMDFLLENNLGRDLLQSTGLHISVIKSSFSYIFTNFDKKIKEFGFLKFLHFLQFLYKNSNYKLVAKGTDYRIVLKNVNLEDYQNVEMNFEQPKIHSQNFYISILENHKPILFIPDDIMKFHQIVDYIFQNRHEFTNRYFHDFEGELMQLFKIDEKNINKILSLFINSDTLIGDQSSIYLKEQNYTLTVKSKDEFFENVIILMKQKITNFFNNEKINDIEFEKVIEFLKVPKDLYTEDLESELKKDKKKSKSKKNDKKLTKKDKKKKTSKSKKTKKKKKAKK
jgi:hypothetical protein